MTTPGRNEPDPDGDLRARVVTALARVPLPGRGGPLATSGLLGDVVVEAGRVVVTLVVEPARAGAMEGARAAVQAALNAVPGVTKALVALTAERGPSAADAPRPAPASAPSAAGARPARHGALDRARVELPGVAAVVAVASGKGGVGKSTTAVNLALGLGRLGLRVGLLDADVYGPSVPRLLGLSGRPESEGKRMTPHSAHGLKVMSIGFMVDEEAALVWRGPMVMSAIQQMLRDVDWGELDVLMVDMPPGTGDAQLTLAQAVPLAGAVIVSTPQDLALLDARRGVTMFRKVGCPILGVVENMSTFLCPACGTRTDLFGHGGARAEAGRLGVPFLGEVPLHLAIRESADAGLPTVVADPDGPHAAAYLAIAGQVRDALRESSTTASPFTPG